MNWIHRMERKYGKYAIPSLMYYIIILYAFGFVLELFAPSFYNMHLSLNAYAILHGEVWRLVTFIIQPPSTSLIFVIFTLYLYYVIGRQLEYTWGTFRFNLYFFTGVVLHIVAAFLAYFVTGVTLPIGTTHLNLSLFFAYAAMYPNQHVLLFGVLPIKMKFMGLINGAYFVYAIAQAFMPAYGGNMYVGAIYKANALAAFVSILNFVIFFFSMGTMRGFGAKEMHRRAVYRKEVRAGEVAHRDEGGARHRCYICGRTELDDPDLEFRYCSKCNGNYEYCQDHLFTHEHVK